MPTRGTRPVLASRGSWFGSVTTESFLLFLSTLRKGSCVRLSLRDQMRALSCDRPKLCSLNLQPRTHPSQPQPEPWTPTVCALIVSCSEARDPKCASIALSNAPVVVRKVVSKANTHKQSSTARL